ncbi:MAG TPA: hypothetical protein VIL85_08825 [Thermomicrobiales bacterium]|jgi:predicted RNA-binding Zn-ribbon protein involved in translation (DUF1610 family)
MLITNLHAIDPDGRDPGDEIPTITPEHGDLPRPFPDGYGDFACGHCGLVLLRGEIDVPTDEGRAVAPDHHETESTLIRCPGCGWDNQTPGDMGAAMP